MNINVEPQLNRPGEFMSPLSARSRTTLSDAAFEALEPRRLFAAGQLDLTFGGGDGQTLISSTGIAAEVDHIVRLGDGKLLVVGERLPEGATLGHTKLNLIR